MKKFKLTLAAIALLLGVIGASAFNTNNLNNVLFDSAFEYDGEGDPKLPENYVKVNQAPSCPGSNLEVCYIIAPEDPVNPEIPVIDEDLENEIEFAVANQVDRPEVKLWQGQ